MNHSAPHDPGFLARHGRSLTAATIALALGWAIWSVRGALTAVLAAYVLAYITRPFVLWLRRKGVSSLGAVGILLAIATVLLAFIVFVILPAFVEQAIELAQQTPQLIERANDFYRNTVQPFLRRNLQIRFPGATGDLRKLAQSEIQSELPNILNMIGSRVGGAFSTTILVLTAITTAALVPFFMFFFVRDYEQITGFFANLVPPRFRDQATDFLVEVNQVVAAYFRGVLTVMLILMVYYSAALALAGLEMWIALGILSGLLFLVPFIGPLAAFTLCALFALFQGGGLSMVLAVVIVFALAQILEGWVLTPAITGSSLGLHAWEVVLALLIAGSVAGFVGLVFALPLAAIFKIALRRAVALYQSTSFYNGDG